MADKEFYPLSTATVRSLNDKVYEKRKGAALEIEKMVKEFLANNQTEPIQRLLKVLSGDYFTLSHNLNSKKGGLIGMAALAVAFGKEAKTYAPDLITPVLSCFRDQDNSVRFYACEAMYNIAKVLRGAILQYFNDIFDVLTTTCADPDRNVRSATETLDRLIKDIVTESPSFDLVGFIPLLRERMYTQHSSTKQFLISWITVLDEVPDINMVVFLPEILDGMFQILHDTNPEIRKMCEAALGEFLREITLDKSKADLCKMTNILLLFAQKEDDQVKLTSLMWLKEFVSLDGRNLLPYTAGIVNAALPCLSLNKRDIQEAARSLDKSLRYLIGPEDDASPPKDNKHNQSAVGTQQTVETSDDGRENKKTEQLDIRSIVEVLSHQMVHNAMPTRLAALKWIHHLLITVPHSIFQQVEDFFSLLLKSLSDPADEVVLRDLEVLAEISSNTAGQYYSPKLEHDVMPYPNIPQNSLKHSGGLNRYFTKFMISLLNLFSTDQTLLDGRGPFIIRQLCILLNAEDIYRTLAVVLLHEEDLKFTSLMVQYLNSILVTSTELFELRNQLKDLQSEESCSLFVCLYKCWCHNPVTTVSLCFLTQTYQHTADILELFGDLEITVDFLAEIDKLVQLLESPIFTYLRLQLLDTQHNQFLVKSLYGLLMLLPQSEAFNTLRRRLECVPNIHFQIQNDRRTNLKLCPSSRPMLKKINFKELLSHFQEVQTMHKMKKRNQMIASVSFKDNDQVKKSTKV